MRNILMSVILLFLSCTGKYQEPKNDIRLTEDRQKESTAYIIDIYKEKFENKQEISLEQDSFFVRDSVLKFLRKRKMELEKSFSKRTGNSVYPNYYGGSYIDRETNKFYIQVVDTLDHPAVRSDIVKRIGHGDFSIHKCSYSLKMLGDTLNALEIIFNRKKKILPPSLKMSRFEIDEQNNTILVLLEDSTSDAVSTFKKYVKDSPMIQFAQQPVIYLQ